MIFLISYPSGKEVDNHRGICKFYLQERYFIIAFATWNKFFTRVLCLKNDMEENSFLGNNIYKK